MATIIDALLVTLGLDDAQFKKGQQSARSETEQTRRESERAHQDMQRHAKTTGEAYEGLAGKVGELLALFFGVHQAGEFFSGFVEGEEELGKFSSELGLNIQQLQAWQRAVELDGGSAQGFNGVVKQLTSTLALIAVHGPRAKMALRLFEGLGIGEAQLKGKDAFGVLDLLAAKVEKMPKGLSVGLLERLGIDDGTIRVLQKGKEGIAGVLEETSALGTNTAEQAKQAAAFNDAWLMVKFQLQQVLGQVVNALLPAFQAFAGVMKKVVDWAQQHPTVVKAAILGIAGAFGVLAVAAGAAALATFEVSLPILAVAAAVGLLIAAAVWLKKEWDAWENGAGSRLGPLFKMLKDFWASIAPAVKVAFEVVKEYLGLLVDEWMDTFGLLMDVLSGDPERVAAGWKKLAKDGQDLANLLRNAFIYAALEVAFHMNKIFEGLGKNLVDIIYNSIRAITANLDNSVLGSIIKSQLEVPQVALKLLGAHERTAGDLAASTFNGGNSTSNSTSLSVGELHLHTQATDGQGIVHDIFGLANRGLVIQPDSGF